LVSLKLADDSCIGEMPGKKRARVVAERTVIVYDKMKNQA
jgi:hypothetical protein